MKTRCLSGGVTTKRKTFHSPLALTFALTAALTVLNFDRPAMADTQLDRTYALETIGYLNAWDNVDGIFVQYVSEAIEDFFKGQSRFILRDVSKANELLGKSKIDYRKIIEDKEILAQMSRSTRSQTLLRTRIAKEGPSYRFHIEWLHAPRMDVLAEERFTLTEIGDIRKLVSQALDRLIDKVPFRATLTGRDHENVTVNIGKDEGIQPGDEMVVATLEDVKRHPLLHTVVDWRLGETGRIRILDVDRGIAFGKIISETEGREVARYQKITRILKRPVDETAPPVQTLTDQVERHARYRMPPRLGWASAGVWAGMFTREATESGGTGREGSGIFFGGKADGQLWLTREFFAEAGLQYGFSPYSQTDSVSGAASDVSGNASLFGMKIAAGYTYFVTPAFFGPKGWIKLGYRSNSYSMTANAAELVGPATFKGLFVGLGGELPVRERYGALMNLEFGIFGSASAPALSALGEVTGSTDVAFQIGGYYRATPRMSFRVALDVTSHGLDFSDGNLTQRAVTLLPSVLFYF